MTRLRIKRTTTVKPDGTRVVRQKLVEAPELEWRLQAAQVRRLCAMPEYGSQFLLVGGMEAGRRGMQESVKAKATGLTAGHPDLTIFLPAGRCAFIENKAAKGRLSTVQVDRHAALRAIGHTVEVVKASTETEAADAAERLVREWLAAPMAGPVAANENAKAESAVSNLAA